MNYLRRVIEWIVSLESGKQFRKWVSILLKISGVLALIGAIVGGIAGVVSAIQIAAGGYGSTSARTLEVIGSILSLALSLLVGIIIIMLYWNRANKISELGEESHFTLMPIAIILIRLLGEGGFISLVGTGIQSLVASILGSQIGFLGEFLDIMDLPREVGFMSGVISFVTSVLIGAALLIVTYFIAEKINLLVDMATNLRKIETRLSVEETTSSS